MNAFSIGISAIASGRRALDLVGQNVANATTPGYHRQSADLVSTTADGKVGTGVDVASITRYDAPPVRTAILQGNAQQAALTARAGVRQQVEGTIRTGAGGIGDGIEHFFGQVAQLTATPDDPAVRRPVLAAAADLARQLNSAAGDLDRLRGDVGGQITRAVGEVNQYATQIADLNVRIAGIQGQGGQANDLLDQRDQLIANLSQRIDLTTVAQPFGVVNVLSAGAPVVVGQFATQFQVGPDPTGNLVVTQTGSTQPVTFAAGTLGGLLQEYNQDLPATRARLDGVAKALISQVNQVQATGLGTTGPLTSAAGSIPVANPAAPLATQNLTFPPQAGRLAITLTDTATGQRTDAFVAIDPATQSLQAVAGAITAGTGGRVQATVDAATNTLRFQAQPGTQFDFTGRVPSPPNAVSMGGTSTPQVDGVYTGPADDTYSYQITGSGTVGVTPGLQLQVKNAANSVIATLNVGQGYTPGTALPTPNGLTVRLSAGTTTNGSFSVPAVATPDSAGLLTGLGVNGLFTGTGASSIAVRPDIQANPALLAGARTSRPGDGTNLERLAAVHDQAVISGRTLSGEYTDLASSVGTDVKDLGSRQSVQAGVLQNLSTQEQAVTGVDMNEELVHLVNYQRMIEGASKYMSAVNTALDSLMNLIR